MSKAEVLFFNNSDRKPGLQRRHEIYEQIIIPPRLTDQDSRYSEVIQLEEGAKFSILMDKKQTKAGSGDIAIGGVIWSPNNLTMAWTLLIDGLTPASRELWEQRLDKAKVRKTVIYDEEIDLTNPDVALADMVRLWAKSPYRYSFTHGFIKLLTSLHDERSNSIDNFQGSDEVYSHPLIELDIRRNNHKQDLYQSLGLFINTHTPKALKNIYNWRSELSKWYINGPFADAFIIKPEKVAQDYTWGRDGLIALTPSHADIFVKGRWTRSGWRLQQENGLIHVNIIELTEKLIEELKARGATQRQIEKIHLQKVVNMQYATLPTSFSTLNAEEPQRNKMLMNQSMQLIRNTTRDMPTSATLATDGAIFSSREEGRSLKAAREKLDLIQYNMISGTLEKLQKELKNNSLQDDVTAVQISM